MKLQPKSWKWELSIETSFLDDNIYQKEGKLTLKRSTLSRMHIYTIPLFELPKGTRLEKIWKDFIWGGGHMDNKLHLVRWDTVCSNKKRGRLGIKNLSLVNRALLGKSRWRFAMEENSFWAEVIWVKYKVKEEVGWFTKVPKEAMGKEAMGLACGTPWARKTLSWKIIAILS